MIFILYHKCLYFFHKNSIKFESICFLKNTRIAFFCERREYIGDEKRDALVNDISILWMMQCKCKCNGDRWNCLLGKWQVLHAKERGCQQCIQFIIEMHDRDKVHPSDHRLVVFGSWHRGQLELSSV
jgi:hypothetical protein